jgi:hypothetical protein
VHYRVDGHIIRTERTAKPRAQASAALKRWLLRDQCRGDVLDFGCGRLRYGPELATVSTTLTFVDSREQLYRICSFETHRETVAEQAARNWPKARTLDYDALLQDGRQYDFILCANVLSAIPLERERRKIVRILASRLKRSGQCLFVTQYRNSYYRELESHPAASPHLDGFLVDRGSGSTFFGLISKDRLIRLTRHCGLQTDATWLDGQSAYVLCSQSSDDSRNSAGGTQK